MIEPLLAPYDGLISALLALIRPEGLRGGVTLLPPKSQGGVLTFFERVGYPLGARTKLRGRQMSLSPYKALKGLLRPLKAF